MKRKSIFTLGTILVSAALVGGTFASVAAWAVTDNANPFGIRITPDNDLPAAGGNDVVTLEWGAQETITLADVTGLAVGQEKLAGVVYVKATTGLGGAFTGNLGVTLTTNASGDVKLIDYITVDVYNGVTAKPSADPFLTVPYVKNATTYYTANADQEVTSGTPYAFAFYVSLQAVNPTIYNTIKSQIVTLTVDWNKGSSIAETTSTPIYFKDTNGWNGVKLYAWDSTGKAATAWPGVTMTCIDGTNKIYMAELETGYTNVVFSKLGDSDAHQTEDLVYSPSKPYYNGSAWVDDPGIAVTEPDYYLVGDDNDLGWDIAAANKLTKGEYTPNGTSNKYTYKSVQYTFNDANQGVKVISSTNVWYGENGQTDGNNFVMTGAGKYTFYFNPDLTTAAIYAEYQEL